MSGGWIRAWQSTQTIKVFDRRCRMAVTQSGALVGLYLLRSTSRRTWWTVIPSRDWHSSQFPAFRRSMSRRFLRAGHGPSCRRAWRTVRRGMPANRAVNSLPDGVRRTASKHRRFPWGGYDGALEALTHYPGWASVLLRQGREHRPFHHPADLVEPVDVAGHLVVLRIPSVLRAVDRDDVVVAGAEQFVSDQRPVGLVLVLAALGLDPVDGHVQGDRPVEGTSPVPAPRVLVPGRDVVAEEPRRVGAGVGDQGLLR